MHRVVVALLLLSFASEARARPFGPRWPQTKGISAQYRFYRGVSRALLGRRRRRALRGGVVARLRVFGDGGSRVIQLRRRGRRPPSVSLSFMWEFDDPPHSAFPVIFAVDDNLLQLSTSVPPKAFKRLARAVRRLARGGGYRRFFRRATKILGIRYPKKITDLMVVLESQSWSAYQAAARRIARRRRAATLVALRAALRHKRAAVRARAAAAQIVIGDRAATTQLIVALGDSSPRVRASAAEALGALRAQRAVKALVAALADRAPRVQREAHNALKRLTLDPAQRAVVARWRRARAKAAQQRRAKAAQRRAKAARRRSARPRRPRVTVKTLRVDGTLPRRSIDRVVRRLALTARACYLRRLRRFSALAGVLSLRLRVSPVGRVTRVTAARGTVGDDALERCIRSRARRARFPPPSDGAYCDVSLRFTFTGPTPRRAGKPVPPPRPPATRRPQPLRTPGF